MKPEAKTNESSAGELARAACTTSILLSEAMIVHANALLQAGAWQRVPETVIPAQFDVINAAGGILARQIEKASEVEKADRMAAVLEEFRWKVSGTSSGQTSSEQDKEDHNG